MLPLVICAGPRALPTAVVASDYYAVDGINSLVVRPAAYADQDFRFGPSVRFIDDEALEGVEVVSAYLRAHIEQLGAFDRTPGWFLQQYIKLAAVSALDAEYVFVADGDTIFSRQLMHEVLRNPVVLTTGERYENYDRLLTILGLIPPELSCVANGNVFSHDPLIKQLSTPDGFISILENHVIPSSGNTDFSEYQITGSILQSKLGMRRLKMFRRFDLLIGSLEDIPVGLVENALLRYDAVAIEANHVRSVARRVAARLFYGVGRSW